MPCNYPLALLCGYTTNYLILLTMNYKQINKVIRMKLFRSKWLVTGKKKLVQGNAQNIKNGTLKSSEQWI